MQLLVPFSMKHLLEDASWFPGPKIERISKTFMKADCQPKEPPPILYVHFNEVCKLLVDMISYVLGFKTSEHVDETVLVLLSSFSQGQPPSLKYNYAKFIANKIHDQLIKLEREGVFKYSSYIYHCSYIISLKASSVP